MWGQVLDESSPIVWLGIIPTRVGTRLNAIRNSASQKDHPNACGDKWYRDFKFPFARGSSPRVWGQVSTLIRWLALDDIIPTRVGTSDRNACRVCKRWDHPHACGDKQDNVEETKQRLGSSPRVWGQVLDYCSGCFEYGIIPTRVGTSNGAIILSVTGGIIPTRVGTSRYNGLLAQP